VWRQADRYQVPRIAFINKMDLPGAYFESVLAQMQKRLGCEPLPIQIPLGEEEFHRGVIDLVRLKAVEWEEEQYAEVPMSAEELENAKQARQKMLEKLAEYDEPIFNKIFDAPESITQEEVEAAIRKVALNRQLIPVLCGSAYRNKGVQPLLDAICAYLPSPDDVGTITGEHPKTGKKVERKMQEEAPFAALVFKIALDDQHRKIAFFRIYSGLAKRGAQVLNTRTGQKERLANIYRLSGDKRTALQEVKAGDIAVLANVKDVQTGDTLCDIAHPLILEAIPYPDPVIGMVVEAQQSSDLDKLEDALMQLEAEDPSLQVLEDEESGNTLLRGMGELHLDVIAHRLRDEFRVPVSLGRPKVNYKEQLTKTVDYTYEYIRPEPEPLHASIAIQLGPADDAFLESPAFLSGKTRLQFEQELDGKKLPLPFLESIRKGFERMTLMGVEVGFALHGLKVKLLDADTYEHSSELAFELCARNTFRRAAPLAAPVIIEPIMSLEINCPEEYIGNIMGDLNRRRGQPLGMEPRTGYSIIRAQAPLSELFGYAAHIRTLSTGRATASVTFSHYAPLTEEASSKMKGDRKGFML
jgi:elongation factor G